MSLLDSLTLTVTDAPADCVGQYFRYTQASFVGKNGRYVTTQEIRPLKSVSCPGCIKCGWVHEALRDMPGGNAVR